MGTPDNLNKLSPEMSFDNARVVKRYSRATVGSSVATSVRYVEIVKNSGSASKYKRQIHKVFW